GVEAPARTDGRNGRWTKVGGAWGEVLRRSERVVSPAAPLSPPPLPFPPLPPIPSPTSPSTHAHLQHLRQRLRPRLHRHHPRRAVLHLRLLRVRHLRPRADVQALRRPHHRARDAAGGGLLLLRPLRRGRGRPGSRRPRLTAPRAGGSLVFEVWCLEFETAH